MTKAQRRTKKAIAAILEATELTQGQLAEMTGASLDTVKSWTRKTSPNPISYEFETRLLIATGAEIGSNGSVATSWRVGSKSGLSGKPYTLESFKFWVQQVNKPESVVPDKWIEPAKQGIELLLKAATKKTSPRSRTTNFATVLHSFEKWVEQTAKEFDLEKNMLKLCDELPKEKRYWRINPGKPKR